MLQSQEGLGEGFFPGSAPSNQGLPPPEPGCFRCTVLDHEKKGDGIYQYVTYRIDVTSTSAAGQVSQNFTTHRFSDFLWLQEQLIAKYPGLLVPPLPDKAVTGRFTAEFIGERRRGLQTFLDRLAQHPELRHATDVELFLHGSESDFSQAKEGNTSAQKKLGGFMSFMKESAFALGSTLVPTKERERTPDDQLCEQVMQYANSLETSLASVHTNADALVRKNKELAKHWFELGLASTMLGQYETNQQEEKLGSVFTKLGGTADRLAVLLTQKVERDQIEFVEQLKDHVKIVESLKQMMKTRAQILANYHASLTRLESRQSKLDGAGSEKSSVEKSVIEAQALVDNDKQELARVTSLCLHEAAKFREYKRRELRNMVIVFVKSQIEHSRKAQQTWENLLPSLQ